MATHITHRPFAGHSDAAKRHVAEARAERAHAIKVREKRNSAPVAADEGNSNNEDVQKETAAARTLTIILQGFGGVLIGGVVGFLAGLFVSHPGNPESGKKPATK